MHAETPVIRLSGRRPTQRATHAATTRVRSHAADAGLVVLLVAVGYLVLSHLVRIQMLALDDGAGGYRRAFSDPRIRRVLWTTLQLGLGSLVISMVLGTALAWCSTRLPARMRAIALIPVLPLVVPAVANISGWTMLLAPRSGYLNKALRALPWWSHLERGPVDVFTTNWIILLTGFSLTSFVYLFVLSGLSHINRELLEAGEVCGSSPLGVFLRITLPLLRPVLVYGAGVAMLLGLGQFTAPLLLGRAENIQVLTTQMYAWTSLSPIDFGAAAAVGSPLLLLGVSIVLFQRWVLRDHHRFVTQGGRAAPTSGRPSRAMSLPLLGYAAVATVLPLAALTTVALQPFWSGEIDVGSFSLVNFRTILDNHAARSSIVSSVTIAAGAVLIAIPVGFVVACILHRRRHHPLLRLLLDLVVNLPLGIPAVVFGAGFLFAYTRPPLVLYGTQWVILLVYVTLMLPFTTRMQLAGLSSLGHAYIEASGTCGGGVVRTHLRIVLPLLRSSVAGAAALMFVLLTHEFAASLLVRSARTQVMGTVLYDYWINGSLPVVAAMALIMTAVTAAGVALAMLVGGSDVLRSL